MMRRLLFMASLVLSGCNAPEVATLVIKTEQNSEIVYWGAGKDEIYSYRLGQKDSTDAEGYWTYQTTLAGDSKKVLAVNALWKPYTLYLTPGCCDTLTISMDTMMLSGTNVAYNRCLQAVDDYQSYCDAMLRRGTQHDLLSVTTPDELKRINGIHYDKAANVIRNSGLPTAFVEEQLAHLDIISRQIVAYTVMYTIADKTDEWKNELRKALLNPWNEEAMRSYRGAGRIAMQLVPMKFLVLDNGDNIKEPYRFIFDSSKELFCGKALERVLASFIYGAIMQQNKDEAFIGLFDSFKGQYPNSPYLATLQSGIEEIVRFHQGKLNEDLYHIIPYDSSMTSISEAVQQFKGKVVYVDVWATWCGPCKEMFGHVPAFKERAKALDIVYLYLSIDRPQEENIWRKSIPFYDLRGYHLLAGDELTKAVYRELGNERGILSIPRFLIIGKDGKIAVPDAAAPDQPEKLIEQLNQVLAM